ncbi:MAG TPA: hypothetical protein VGS18_02100, partial [Thermoplasmata archaeon]|nr:hypothetical protein [Thermoplasmata archaeon]
VELILAATCARWLVAHLGSTSHELHEVYLATGLLSFLLAMATVEEFVGDWGSILAVGAVLYLLYRLRARWIGGLPTGRSPPLSPPISA